MSGTKRRLAVLLLTLVGASGAVGVTAAGDTFPGRNGRIAYVSVRHGAAGIWSMAADGTGQRALSPRAGLYSGSGGPSWSPDGRELAYAAELLIVMNADGSARHPVEGFSVDAFASDPTWAPDGARIAFGSDREGQANIWWVGAGGGEAVRLTRHTGPLLDDAYPAWSPDGKKIAFVRGAYVRRTGLTPHDVYLMNPDGTGLAKLTRTSADELQPDWSPDGKSIAFVRIGKLGGEIWVMAADGSGARKLTRGRVSDWQPSWSPDGTQLAFTRGLAGHFVIDVAGKYDVHVMNADSTGVRRVTKNPDIDADPAWQPLPG